MYLAPLHAHLSSTNAAPLESEADRAILQARDRLSYIDSETKNLRGLMDVLPEEGKDLRHHVEQHVAVVLPMRRFPPEVLAEIFW
ncbi:hypothetical protein C8R44DRAFT_599763 [Mycena epipterygia]|nr:hypothetical protein C8R44DRAFT_599763 [Mycena epipterygia]